ncbi:hypothetical protein H9Q71_000588 [Fusarium xylarioides]|nr:hypothetical protein H9Q71_000588 [Fusarium xylarioides]
MHSSYFSYNLSRPYPYVWFTPVVVAGGLIATALIAFLSVATQGYETVSMATSKPNETNHNQNPFSNWPSFLTANTKSVCSATKIPIGTLFYTNNTALKYTVTKIWRGDNPNSPDALLGSLPYLSNRFENCAVNTPSGKTTVNMTTVYNYNGIDNDVGSAFPGRNDTTKASLWWGESLLAWYSIALTNDMHVEMHVASQRFWQGFQGENKTNYPPIYKGHISFSKRKTLVPSVQDIGALDFFQVSCFFVPFSNNGVAPGIYYCDIKGMGNSDLIEKLSKADESDHLRPLPGIWISADSLAKAFYFTILADLGQTDSGPNILDNVELLTQSTRSYEAIRDRQTIWGDNLRVNETYRLAQRAFTQRDPSATNLVNRLSVISTTFLCQIPRLKSTPSLVVSVIINTLVILSAFWKLYSFIIDSLLSRRHPEMMNCAGCPATTQREAASRLLYSPGQPPQSLGTPSGVKARYSSIRQEDN